ncbi:MAG: hypothetical protein QXD42_04040 [Nitrososphaerales archaeon]
MHEGLEFTLSSLDEDLKRIVKRKKVAYLRELQVGLEDSYKHWDVTNALKNLVPLTFNRKSYKGHTW